MKAKFDEISDDIQRFREVLRLISSTNPKGVTEDEVLSMAMVKHLGNRTGMFYDARSFPHAEWKFHLAYKVLRSLAKYSDESSVCSDDPASVDGMQQSSEQQMFPTEAATSGRAPDDFAEDSDILSSYQVSNAAYTDANAPSNHAVPQSTRPLGCKS